MTPSPGRPKPGQEQRGERGEGKGAMKGRGLRGAGDRRGKWGGEKEKGEAKEGGDTVNENEEFYKAIMEESKREILEELLEAFENIQWN